MVKKKIQDVEAETEDAGQPQADSVPKRAKRRATSKEVQRMKSEKTRPRTAKPPAKTSKKRLQANGAEPLLAMNSMERRRLLEKKLSPFDLGMEFAQKRHGQPPVRADQAFLQQILELRTQIRKYEEQQYKSLKYQSLMAGFNNQNPATMQTAYLAKPTVASTRPAPVHRKAPAAAQAKPKPRSKTEPRIQSQAQKSQKPKPAKKTVVASDGYVRIKPPTSGKKQIKKKKKQRNPDDLPQPANGLKEIKEEGDEIDENDLPRDSSRKGGFDRSPYDEDVKIDEEERPEEPARVQLNEDSKKKPSSASPNPPKNHDDLIKVDVAEEKNRKEKERKEKADKEQREKEQREKEKKDKEDRDRKEREKREKEVAVERERIEREKKEKADREREREREKAERDRKENERLEKEMHDKQNREKAEREKIEREKQEKLAAEKKEKERMLIEENERREKQLAKEKADREKQEKDKERAEREKVTAHAKPSAADKFEEDVPRKNLIVDDNIMYDDDKDDEQFQDGEEEENAEGNEEELNEEMLRFYNEIPVLNEVSEPEVDRFKHKMVEHIYKYQILNAEEYQSLFQAAYYKNKDVIGQEEMAQIFEDLAAAIEQQGEEEGTEEGLYEEYPHNGFDGE